MFFIAFDHAKAHTSMRLLMEKHNILFSKADATMHHVCIFYNGVYSMKLYCTPFGKIAYIGFALY